MGLLHKTWSRLLLPATVFSLLFNPVPFWAAEKSEEGVVQENDIDLAKVQAGGKVVLISSGTRGGRFRAIDDDHRTTFQFSSSDPRPTLIVRLLDSRPIHRVSVVVGSAGGKKIDVYLLQDLPRRPSDLDDLNPVASIVDPGIAREAAVDFAPQTARYVALRWTLSAENFGTLNLAEVSAIGRGESPVVSAELAATDPPIYVVAGPPILPPVSH